MITLLYWNLRKRTSNVQYFAEAAKDAFSASGGNFNADILVCCVAEAGAITGVDLINEFDKLMPGINWVQFGPGNIICITNVSLNIFLTKNYLSGAYHLLLACGSKSYLISFVHVASPFGKWHPDQKQSHRARDLREEIEKQETHSISISKGNFSGSVVMGDFNMNPYDYGMISVDGLNAAMCKILANRGPRKHGARRTRSTQFYYNLMWKGFGDPTSLTHPGTFFNKDIDDALYWHALDQILVRPSLIDDIVDLPVILTKIGKTNLIKKEQIDQSISDHLPITVTLKT